MNSIEPTALDLALEQVLNASGFNYSNIAPNVGYFHFASPQANVFTLAAAVAHNMSSNSANANYLYFSIPQIYTIHEASVSKPGGATFSSHFQIHLITAGGADSFFHSSGFTGPQFVPSLSPGSAYRIRAHGDESNRHLGIAVALVTERPE